MDGLGDLQADPIARFRSVPGDFREPETWPDYQAEFGIGHEHVPALIRIACDLDLHNADQDSTDLWAPVHAWRALAQLRAAEAVEPLLALLKILDFDDAADVDLPVVFSMIGPAAIPPIARFVADPSTPTMAAVTAINALQEIATHHPGCRSECVDIIASTLQPPAQADATVTGFAICSLVDLDAVEAIEPIRQAFRSNAVDISIPGDLEDVEIALGVRHRRHTPKPRYGGAPWPPRLDARPSSATPNVGRNEPCPCGSGREYKKCCLN